MSISTEKGDFGKSYWMGREADKDSPLLEAIGTIDELQSFLGLAKTKLAEGSKSAEDIYNVEVDLVKISGEIACGQKWEEGESRVKEITEKVHQMESSMPVMRGFVVPGVNEAEASLHVCRTVTRRAERRLVTLNKEQKINENILKYFNRLSDFIYLTAIEQTKK